MSGYLAAGFSDPALAGQHGLPSSTTFFGPVDGKFAGGGDPDSLDNFHYDTGQQTGWFQDPDKANQLRKNQNQKGGSSKKKNTKKPREMIYMKHRAVHKHITPNVVRTDNNPTPYPSIGYADDPSTNVTRRTFAQRTRIHRKASHVNITRKDEPGDPNGGVQSSTRSSIITPITYAPAVRAEGSNVNRHEDYFHGNNKNHLMQVNHVQNTKTYDTSDDQLNEPPDRSGNSPSQQAPQQATDDPTQKFFDNLGKESSTVQAAQGAYNNAQYFYNNPGQILPSAANTASNIWTGVSTSASNAYNYVTNLTPEQAAALPGQAVEGVKNAAVGAYNHYSNIYQQDGIAGLSGAVAGNALDFAVQYVLTEGAGKVAGTVVKGAETAEEAGAAARKAQKAEEAASKDGNARVSRNDDEPNKRGESCGCPE